jgi:hypothetical protein
MSRAVEHHPFLPDSGVLRSGRGAGGRACPDDLESDRLSYRDDRQALALLVAQLERENAELREKVGDAGVRYDRLAHERHETRRKSAAGGGCALCGGHLLPVAVVAGHDPRNPLPLKMSTMRFVSPEGGFTHSAPIRSLACASCGFIHNFISMEATASVAETETDEFEQDRDLHATVSGEPDSEDPSGSTPLVDT